MAYIIEKQILIHIFFTTVFSIKNKLKQFTNHFGELSLDGGRLTCLECINTYLKISSEMIMKC